MWLLEEWEALRVYYFKNLEGQTPLSGAGRRLADRLPPPNWVGNGAEIAVCGLVRLPSRRVDRSGVRERKHVHRSGELSGILWLFIFGEIRLCEMEVLKFEP